eukprot:51692_1
MVQDKNAPYVPPTWAREPALTSSCLLVTKDGRSLDPVYDVSQLKSTVFGRGKSCQVRLLHQSISRQHSVILHGSSGNMYILDLGSSHGTKVNNRKLEPNRRQVLREDDTIKFGASTRKYQVKLNADQMQDQENIGRADARAESKKRRRNSDESDRRSGKRARDSEPAHVRCKHILVKHIESRRPKSWKDIAITRSKEEALELIEKFKKQILDERETFEEIASRESDCNSHEQGGDLGRFERNRMQKPFEEAAFSLRVGEMSEPVETQSGIHLIYRSE